MNPTKIPYIDFVWNPVVGCTPAGEGCRNCYAEAAHSRRHKAYKAGRKLPACYSEPFHVVRCLDERLDAPLKRRKPARIGVNFLADTFHPDVPDHFIDHMFAVMALCQQHTFVLLTKRPERMRAYFEGLPKDAVTVRWADSAGCVASIIDCDYEWSDFPLPNIWLGTTVWNQESADRNIPHLLATPAVVRWVSYEPALGPVDLRKTYSEEYYFCGLCRWHGEPEGRKCILCGGEDEDDTGNCAKCHQGTMTWCCPQCGSDGEIYIFDQVSEDEEGPLPGLHWVVCGGESGPGARPMHPDWAREMRRGCEAAKVPFWFKQWGEWTPLEGSGAKSPTPIKRWRDCEWQDGLTTERTAHMVRVGTKAAGNTLDGEVVEQLPEVANGRV